MTPELTVLALAGPLQSVKFVPVATPANREFWRDKISLSPHVR